MQKSVELQGVQSHIKILSVDLTDPLAAIV